MGIEALYRRLIFSIVIFFTVFVLGAIGYWVIGLAYTPAIAADPSEPYQFTLLNSLYMAAITVSTVGYGEVTNFHAYLEDPGEDVATVFTLVYCLVSYLVVVYASANIVAALVEGAIGRALMMRRKRKMLEALDQHFIVCGAGATGLHIIDELEKVGEKVVVIDGSEDVINKYEGSHHVIGILGDATDDTMLTQAGIQRARGLFAVLHDDKDNLFVVLTARQANAKARLVGRVVNRTNIGKLKSVGADAVVSPNHIGGLRMASEMVRPSVVSFLDTMLRATDASLRFNEVVVPMDSPVANRKLGELNIESSIGLVIIGIYRVDRTIVYNPSPAETVRGGDSLIVISNADQLHALEDHVKNWHSDGPGNGPRSGPSGPSNSPSGLTGLIRRVTGRMKKP